MPCCCFPCFGKKEPALSETHQLTITSPLLNRADSHPGKTFEKFSKWKTVKIQFSKNNQSLWSLGPLAFDASNPQNHHYQRFSAKSSVHSSFDDIILDLNYQTKALKVAWTLTMPNEDGKATSRYFWKTSQMNLSLSERNVTANLSLEEGCDFAITDLPFLIEPGCSIGLKIVNYRQ